MSETTPESGPDPHFIDDFHIGEHIPPGFPVFKPEVPIHLQDRPEINIPHEVKEIQKAVSFKASHGRWRIAKDIIGLVRHGKDGIETYEDKLLREARRSKKSESATYGIAHIQGEDAVLYAMNWDYFNGSVGIVAGEKFQAAADLAINKKLPFVSIYASSGVRQQENTPGLIQMTRMVESIRHYREKSTQPHIAVLLGNVWGGMSASAVPIADLVIALAGTNYGFAGPNVIEAYEGKPVTEGAQTAETNAIDRNIDVILADKDELIDYLGSMLKSSKLPDKQHVLDENSEPFIRNISAHDEGRIFSFKGNGFGKPKIEIHEKNGSSIVLKNKPPITCEDQGEALINQYQDLISNANRVDLEFILQHSFSDAVPFYNHIIEGEIKRYPAVVGALAKIGTQPFVVVGTQPSFQRLGNSVRKLSANPGPEDFEYMERILEMGARHRLPALFVTDTLGAEPTEANERNGLSRSIARLILKGIDYPEPAISLVTGALGSGGGLATTPIADHVMMLENAMAFVAEPRSAASILYKTAEPSREEIKTTLSTIRSTAQDQLDMGLIDEVIAESPSPYETAENIHKAVLNAYVGLAGLSQKRLRSRRSQRIRNLKGFEIVRETP